MTKNELTTNGLALWRRKLKQSTAARNWSSAPAGSCKWSSRTNNQIFIFNRLRFAAGSLMNTATTPSRQHKLPFMRSVIQTVILIILLASCGPNPKQKSVRITNQNNDTLFELYDRLNERYNSVPTNFDSLYSLSKEIKDLADNYKKPDKHKIPEIYKRCADVFRVHCPDYCGSNNSPILCCKDSLEIIDCYLKAINIYKSNNDTTKEGYTDAIYQLADVYDQLNKSELALPLRQDYLRIIQTREGSSSDMAADAFMFIGYTCELLYEFKLANNYYQEELKIRERLSKGDLKIVRDRIAKFKKEHNLSDN